MLSDNIKSYRKANNMSQEDLAQKLDVSRQSVSLWETGQAQPTIDNIIALTRIFGISSDELLGNVTGSPKGRTETEKVREAAAVVEVTEKKDGVRKYSKAEEIAEKEDGVRKSPKTGTIIAATAAIILIAVFCMIFVSKENSTDNTAGPETTEDATVNLQNTENPEENAKDVEPASGADVLKKDSVTASAETDATAEISETSAQEGSIGTDADASSQPGTESAQENADSGRTSEAAETSLGVNESDAQKTGTTIPDATQTTENKPETNSAAATSKQEDSAPDNTQTAESQHFDLFTYCRNFAIEKGSLNGDYCMYQQPSTLYGGYDDEYFSVSYWADSNMVEFCLHCPLSDTYSVNFYLRMRGGYNGRYEYLSSKYYRSDGTSLRSAMGYIDPAVFSEKYPLSCDEYEGSLDGQTEFMEESRVGMCDLIKCLKQFVTVEKMDCSFRDFGFINF